MELKELMAAFAAKLGIAGLEVKDGSCSLEIDGIPVEILETEDGSHFVASAGIGTPPLEKTADFFRMILAANVELFARHDVAFGLSPESGDLVLQWRLPAQGLDLDSFCTRLAAFLDNVEQWRKVLDDFGAAADEAAVREEDAPVFGSPDSGFPMGGFMQV